jgi:hypothetical protein
MSWRIAESLKRLREQINAAFPTRDKTSDGGIGDAAHASRNSDHNPWVSDGKQGVVTAIDIDEDLGVDDFELEDLITAIRKSKDPRVKYIIYEGRITVAGSNLQRWKKYTGKNSHSHHAHISVHSDRKLYDDRSDWYIGIKHKPATTAEPASIALPESSESVSNVAASEPAVPAQPSLSLPSNIAMPIVAQPAVAVAQVSAEAEAEKEVSGIKASTAGAVTFITGTGAAIVSFLQDKGWEIVIGIAVFGAIFVVARFWYSNREKERQTSERLEREKRAHEVQMAMLKSAMDPNLTTVTVVPQPIQNSEAAQNQEEPAE